LPELQKKKSNKDDDIQNLVDDKFFGLGTIDEDGQGAAPDSPLKKGRGMMRLTTEEYAE